MKNYISRVLSNAKKWELVYWWVLRLIMIYGIISRIIKPDEELGIYQPIQMTANLAGMFAFEVFQATSERNLLRYIPAYCQDVSIMGLFLASFGGAYLNLYYTIWWWDTALHFVGGGFAVILGYEVVCAMQKRDKKYSPVPIVLLCAFGYSFMLGIAWELFEFTFDQLAGGDAQHWSYALAEAADYTRTIFTLSDIARFPIMDTMADIVFNTIGAVIVYVTLYFFPYNHKGKRDINALFDQPSQRRVKSKTRVR